jgi:hypothetical protein
MATIHLPICNQNHNPRTTKNHFVCMQVISKYKSKDIRRSTDKERSRSNELRLSKGDRQLAGAPASVRSSRGMRRRRGVDLTLPITKETIAKNEVFFVDKNALAACFDKDGGITEEFCKELAKREPLRVVFRDAGFKDDSVKINVEQIFKLMSPHTEVKSI